MIATKEKTNGTHTEGDKFNMAVESTADTLLKGCSKVRCRYGWFSTAAKIDDDVLGEMMGKETPQEVKDAMTAQKRLLKSKHEALVNAKQAFQAVKDYVSAMTIPLVALRAGSDDEADLRKDGGVRLIQKKDMQEFDDRMKYLVGLLNTSVEKLQKALPSIKAEDKTRLDRLNTKLYDDGDYPADVTKLVHVTYGFEPIGVDAEWSTLCPEIYKRESANARKKFEAVVESAAVEFAGRFVKYVKQVIEQLGNRVRLNPVKDRTNIAVRLEDDKTASVNISDAEVIGRLTHDDEPDEIPENHLLLQLRLKKAISAKGRSTEVWLAAPIKESDYHTQLRPYESNTERKKLYDSTVDNLKAELAAFANVGEMLGPYQGVVGDGIKKVKEMLTKASGSMNTETITMALREGSYFRNEMKAALESVAHTVSSKVGEAQAKRRSIKKKLIGAV